MKRVILITTLLLVGCTTPTKVSPDDPARYQPKAPIHYTLPS